MKLKHAILAELGRDQLKRIVDDLEIDGVDRCSVDDMRQALSRTRRATPALLLEQLGEAAVKLVCHVVGVSAVGRRTQLIERLLAEPPGSGDETDDKTPASPVRDAALDSSQRERMSPPRSVGATAVESLVPSASRGKRAIEQYEHDDKERANNPPVGLVTSHTDPDAGKKRYAYDPHLDPTLVWAGKAEQADFLVRLCNGTMLVLEVKGQDSLANQAKRQFLDEWVRAVNGVGDFGRWASDVSRHPKDMCEILRRHAATP